MLAGILLAAAVATTPPRESPPREPTLAELRAQNDQLKAQNAYLQGLVTALRIQREQAADQAAQTSAQAQSQQSQRPR